MARFYGTIQGRRGPASRLGDKNSGLRVTAQSYNGDVVVSLSPDGDADQARVSVQQHGGGPGFCMFAGDVAKLLTPEGQKAWIKWLVRSNKLRDEIVREFAQEALRKKSTGE